MGDNSGIDRVIAHIAARQQRNITRAQALAAGWNDDAIRHRLEVGRLYRTFPGVYTVGAPAITPQEHAMAAVLACGPGAVLSHGSALALWGIWKRWERPVHVTTPHDRRPKGIRVHRARRLDRRDVTRQQGIAVTTLARTLLDQASQMTPKSLNRAINNARLDRHLTTDALHDVISRHSYHPGKTRLQYCAGITTRRPTRSSFEDEFPAFCRRYGLPEPQMDTVVGGYELDAFFPLEGVIVELDSWEFHSSRTSFEGDRNKDADTLAAGLVTVRITGERFKSNPEQEAARLRRILARRRTEPV